MARQKLPYIVVAFDSTADALAMEAAAKQYRLPGRAIPVPKEISAGCGTAWAVACCKRTELEQAIQELALVHAGFYLVDLY